MNSPKPTPVPDLLRGHLAAADRVWQREKARAFAWRAAPWLLGFALCALAADAFLQLAAGVRIGWIVTGFGAVAALAAWCTHVGWRRRNPPERTARFLEARDARLGSRLINALQLSAQASDPAVPALTRNLAASAVARYGAALAEDDLPRLATTGSAHLALKRASWAALASVALLAAFYPVARVVLPRFLDPLGDHPPYAFTRVEIETPGDAGAEVVYGGKLPVRVSWSGHEPRELFLTVHPEGKPAEAVTLPLVREGAKGFSQQIADVRTDLVLIAHSKNRGYYSRQRQARVLLTPKIEADFLQITPPAYTGLKPSETPFAFKTASALAGSELRFRLRSNRPLRNGAIEFLGENGQVRHLALVPATTPVAPPSATAASSPAAASATDATREVVGVFKLDDDVRLRFRVTDISGLPSDEQPEALVSATHDLPPTVRIVDPTQDGFVSLDYKLVVKIEASDDYGLRTLRIHRALNGVYSAPRTVPLSGPGIERETATTLPLDFASLGVRAGDRVSFFAEAIDNAPEPHLSRSQTVTLTLIGVEEYNAFLREQNDVRDLAGKYQTLLEQFQELREAQEKLAAEAAALREKTAAKPADSETAAAFDQLVARQNELNQRLNQQAARMENLVRPQPAYDFERDLQARLKEEAAAIRESTAANRSAVDQLAQASSPAAGGRDVNPATLERLQAEAKAQAERLGAREKQLAEKVEKPLEDLSRLHDLVNEFNLFERTYQAQQALAEQTRAYQKQGPLGREDQLALKELAARQQAVRETLDELPKRLRERAAAAQEKFPKAAKSGQALADAIERERFTSLAGNATDRMLASDGQNGSLLAQRLEREMGKLFGECCNQQGENAGELDQYLSLTLNSRPGQSFQQMQECRKAGLNPGMFPRMGRGVGQGQGGGYSMNSGPQLSVLGNEQKKPDGPPRSAKSSGNGGQTGGLANGASPAPQLDRPDVLKGLNPADRKSDAVASESAIDEYRAVVDEYFKNITRSPTPPSSP